MKAWQISWRRFTQHIWYRSLLYSVGGVMLAVSARVLAPILPEGFESNIGQSAVATILQILASSMLAVTTFSLSSMVGAYSGASNVTPRATKLLLADTTSQSALSTFLGAFLFSIVGIIMLSTGMYGERGRLLLFIGTIAVIVLIAITLLRWISYITGFGRMSDTINRVEAATMSAVEEFRQSPHMGGKPAVEIPPSARPLYTLTPAYVTHVHMPGLQKAAEECGVTVHVTALPGALVHPHRPVLWVEGGKPDSVQWETFSKAFHMESRRNYLHDPRLGLIALAEIGCRALPPTSNDYGTAIDAINSLQRVFFGILKAPNDEEKKAAAEVLYDRVHVPLPRIDDLVEDAFRGLARDGAGLIEVMLRLCKALDGLAQADPEQGHLFRAMALQALERAELAMDYPPDRESLRDLVMQGQAGNDRTV